MSYHMKKRLRGEGIGHERFEIIGSVLAVSEAVPFLRGKLRNILYQTARSNWYAILVNWHDSLAILTRMENYGLNIGPGYS